MSLVKSFTCERKSEMDEEIYTKNFQPADLCVQVYDNNLISFSFINVTGELAVFRLCWGSFMGFVECLEEWFFDTDEEPMLGTSCIDDNIILQCTSHHDYTVSVAVSIDGGANYNVLFCAGRSKFLGIIDASAMEVEKMVPDDPGCYDGKEDTRILH